VCDSFLAKNGGGAGITSIHHPFRCTISIEVQQQLQRQRQQQQHVTTATAPAARPMLLMLLLVLMSKSPHLTTEHAPTRLSSFARVLQLAAQLYKSFHVYVYLYMYSVVNGQLVLLRGTYLYHGGSITLKERLTCALRRRIGIRRASRE
jgi:hypothetical protein